MHRMLLWNAAGTFARAVQLQGRGYMFGALANGAVISNGPIDRESRGQRLNLNLFSATGQQVRTLRLFDSVPPRRPGPEVMQARPVVGVGRQHVYYGKPDEFQISKLDTLGREVQVFRRELPRQPFSDEDRDDLMATLVELWKVGPEASSAAEAEASGRRMRNEATWPEYRPFFGTILEDTDANVWVEHFRMLYPNMMSLKPKPTTWSVFDATGEFQGEVLLPAGFVATSITTDQVLGLYQDELGVEHARAYRLIKPR